MKVMENDKVVTQATQKIRASPKWGTFCAAPRWTNCPVYQCADRRDVDCRATSTRGAHNEQYRQLIEGYMLRHKVNRALLAGRRLMAGAAKPTHWKNGKTRRVRP